MHLKENESTQGKQCGTFFFPKAILFLLKLFYNGGGKSKITSTEFEVFLSESNLDALMGIGLKTLGNLETLKTLENLEILK